MNLFVNLDTQEITQEAFDPQRSDAIVVPRHSAVPIRVVFTSGNQVIDPDERTVPIKSSRVGGGTAVFNSKGHGFAAGNSIIIRDHLGLQQRAASTTPGSTTTTITLVGHGLVASPPGLDIDRVEYGSNNLWTVEIETPPTERLEGYIVSNTAVADTVLTCEDEHGLHTGDLVTVSGSTTAAINATHSITVTGSKTFKLIGVTGGATSTGSFVRLPSDLTGTWKATRTGADTFTIPCPSNTSFAYVLVRPSTPVPYADGTWTITAVTTDTFTIGGLTLTTAGEGGTASLATDLNLRWSVKKLGEHDGPELATLSTFAKKDNENGPFYTGVCNYTTVEMDAALGIEPTTGGVVTANATTNLLTLASHGFSNTDLVAFFLSGGGTIPGGLVEGKRYYVVSSLTNTFAVAATSGGAAIDLTSAGSATITVVKYPIANDITEIELMGELSWVGANPSKTNWVEHTVRNDVYKSGDAPALLTGTPQSLSGAGAVNITSLCTDFISTGAAQALTLANGSNGQMKYITHVVDGGSGVLTPTTKSGYTTITFTAAGDSVSLKYNSTAGWCIVGSYGVTIA